MKDGFYVALDFETYYEKGKYSVGGAGALTMHQYVDDPRFNAYMVSLAVRTKTAEKFGLDVSGWQERIETIGGRNARYFCTACNPADVNWSQLDGATFIIHNANFDCEVMRRLIELNIAPAIEFDAVDTADMLAYFGYRRNLKDGMKAVFNREISKEVRSNMDGKLPRDLTPVELAALYKYSADDAVECHMLWDELGDKWPRIERMMSKLNRDSNIEGIDVDVELVETGLETLRKIHADAESKLPWVVAENPEDRYPAASLPALAKWLTAHGYKVPKSFNKNGNDFMDWKKTLDPEKDAELLAILEARISVTGTAPHIARLETMMSQMDKNNRLHPGFVYFGAHTGRFTAGVSEEREGAKNLNLLNMTKKPVYGVDMRAMYIAGPGRKLVICDYAQVEARALLWLADDTDMCQALTYDKSKGEKEPNLYQLTAVKMGWCKPEDDIKHNDPPTYQMAKQCVLGLGYSMSTFTFLLRLEANGIVVPSVPVSEWTDDDVRGCEFVFRKQAFLDPRNEKDQYRCGQFIYVRRVVERWRNANWRIAGAIDPESGFRCGGFWREVQATLIRAAQSKAPRFWLDLPSGRRKVYHDPVLVIKDAAKEMGGRSSKYYMARPILGGRSMIFNGGTLTENIVQAMCRDILVSSIVEIHDKHPDWKYLFNVYDEVVFSVPEEDAEYALDEIGEIMCRGEYISEWTKGLPLGVEGCVSDHYTK